MLAIDEASTSPFLDLDVDEDLISLTETPHNVVMITNRKMRVLSQAMDILIGEFQGIITSAAVDGSKIIMALSEGRLALFNLDSPMISPDGTIAPNNSLVISPNDVSAVAISSKFAYVAFMDPPNYTFGVLDLSSMIFIAKRSILGFLERHAFNQAHTNNEILKALTQPKEEMMIDTTTTAVSPLDDLTSLFDSLNTNYPTTFITSIECVSLPGE